MPRWIQTLREALSLDFSTRIFVYAALTGLISGLAAVVFTWGLSFGHRLFMEGLAGYPQVLPAGEIRFSFDFLDPPQHARRLYILVLLPALGGLLSGLLVWRWAPEAQGPGTGAVISAFHNHRGMVRLVVAPVKALATILTLATGGAAGREGPVMQIGASLGSWIGQRLGLSAAQRRILLLAGCAGGLGAIFRAPLGGAVTSVEVLYREDFESDALIPCVTASIVAYAVYMGVFGFSHMFRLPEILFTDLRELWIYLILGVVCAMAGIIYVRVFQLFRDAGFTRLPFPAWSIAAVGGLGVGLMALVDVRVLGSGFGVLQQAIDGELAIRTMMLLAVMKMLATSCTVGSGGSGGGFGPSVFIGGMLGGVIGSQAQIWYPDIVHEPAAYVVVGMGSFLAGVANTPLAALIIVTEMTGSYHLLPALMVVAAVALVLSRKVSIYDDQVQNRFHSPAHLKDFTVDILENLRVGEVLDRLDGSQEAMVSHETPYFTLNALARRLGHLHFVVIDGNGGLRGMIRLDELELPDDEALRNLILIEDMLVEEVEPVYTSDDLHQALQKLLDSGFDKLPVVQRAHGEQESGLVGYLMYSDLLRLYDEEMARVERAEE
ncbi:MAG: chloride channel protein [Gemmatimonadetes bacterium]|nr:chloride channel protein [Gemmatimonadota bacterium]